MKDAQNSIKNEALIRQKVEEIGVFLEQNTRPSAITPLAGRLFVYLLLSDPPHKNFYELIEFLQASKSSISTALKALEQTGIVEYFTVSGDRKRYFRINTDRWLHLEKERIKTANKVLDFTKDALAFRENSEYPSFNNGLNKVLEFHEYMNIGLKKLMQEWENAHGE